MLTIGRYEIIRELGRGGMATVRLALDPSFGRRVAIKVLPRHMLHETEFRARFEREAMIIAALEHPYIVPVYDYGENDGQPFIVMRYMPGGTLAERIAGQPMPLAEIIPIVQRLAEALDEAHSHDIVHRDLKPSNVMFDGKGNAFLSDFGIAKMLESSTMLTATGVMGTPAYMSPEQAMGGDLDGRSDVYSLGVILYEMLTGQQPYSAKSAAAMMMKHVTGPVPPISAETLGLPAKCNSILNRALAKEAVARYQTAWELAEALNKLGTESGVAVPSRPRPPVLAQRPPTRPDNDTGTSVGTKVMDSVASRPLTRPKNWYQRLSRRGWMALIAGLGVLAVAPVLALAVMAGDGFGRRTPTPTNTAPPLATLASSPTFAPTAIPPTPTPFVVTVIATAVPTATPIPSETPTDTAIPPTETDVVAPTRTSRPPTIVPTNTPPPPPTNTPPPTGTSTPTNPPPPDTPPPPPTPRETEIPP